jgi:AcrR family transcriptional regulator
MGRLKTYDNDAIIEAARKVFLKHGPSAPTLAIAQEAGVSEGLLFKRFKTKQTLFLAAMGISEIDLDHFVEERVGQGEVKENLFRAAIELIEHLKEAYPRMMMLWSNRQNEIEQGEYDHSKLSSVEFSHAVAKYLQGEMKIGRVAQVDPLVASRLLVGSAANYVFWELVGLDQGATGGVEMYMRKLIDIIWQGLEPAANRANEKQEKGERAR